MEDQDFDFGWVQDSTGAQQLLTSDLLNIIFIINLN